MNNELIFSILCDQQMSISLFSKLLLSPKKSSFRSAGHLNFAMVVSLGVFSNHIEVVSLACQHFWEDIHQELTSQVDAFLLVIKIQVATRMAGG